MMEDDERACVSGAERWMMKNCVIVTKASKRGLTDYYPLLKYYALYFLQYSKDDIHTFCAISQAFAVFVNVFIQNTPWQFQLSR
jgi:hypothetical protein